METFHNPDRFMSALRQVLTQGRKRIGLLVGAGAPLSIRVDENGKLNPAGKPLIPGIDELTAEAIRNLSANESAAVAEIRGSLDGGGNIELILSKIRLLQQAIGNTPVWGLNAQQYHELGRKVCENIGKIVGPRLPDEKCAYSELVNWIGGTMRSHSIEIFTTNYDLLFEEAFERAKKPYFDGFTGSDSPFFDPVSVASDDLPARWARIWKMHGSIGWAVEKGSIVRGKGRVSTELVYPDHLKYDLTQKQPYSALFERLKHFILTPDSLLISIGFSFRDAHVCDVLDQSLAMNANCAMLALQFKNLDDEEPALRLSSIRPNLSVYAADGAVVGSVRGLWRPGELPKNWTEIRKSFWGLRPGTDTNAFLLGDFSLFSRFCALAQSNDLLSSQAAQDYPTNPTNGAANSATAATEGVGN